MSARNHSLFQVLQGLYEGLARRIYLQRSRSYRSGVSGDHSGDVASQLEQYITRARPKLPPGFAEPAGSGQPAVSSKSTTARTHSVEALPNSLSRNFVSRHGAGAMETHLADKLKQSARDHLHSSIRLANSGDKVNARLHAGIMTSAVKEASHYMDDDQYRQFVGEIRAELDRAAGDT